jgi:hypothetical protein
MSEEAIKRRCADAKQKVMQEYRDRGYDVKKSDNEKVCFIATDKALTHECEVRVCIDQITDQDVKIMLALSALPNQRKVIECRLAGSSRRITRVYDHLNNLCQ